MKSAKIEPNKPSQKEMEVSRKLLCHWEKWRQKENIINENEKLGMQYSKLVTHQITDHTQQSALNLGQIYQ